MSKIALSGNAGGTGTLTISAPDTSTDRTLTLPDSSGTLLTSASDVAASQITGALNATGSAPIYACRAWVNFNGTGTVAIRASGNVSSITDNGTATYTVNFTTAMPDANYSVHGMVTDDGANNRGCNVQGTFGANQTASAVRVTVFAAGVGEVDAQGVFVAIFR